MEEFMNYAFTNKHYFIGIAMSLLGAHVRLLNDKEENAMSKKKAFAYYFTALFVGYLFISLFNILDWQKATGLVCAIAGLISGSIIKFLIKDLPGFMPDIIEKWLRKYLGILETDKQNEPLDYSINKKEDELE